MSINRQIDKQDVVCTHNGILFSHKRNEVLVHATTWKDLENGMLRETTKRNRTNSGLSHLHEIGRLGKFIETASRFEATVCGGAGMGSYCSVDTELLLGDARPGNSVTGTRHCERN